MGGPGRTRTRPHGALHHHHYHDSDLTTSENDDINCPADNLYGPACYDDDYDHDRYDDNDIRPAYDDYIDPDIGLL